MKPFSSFAIPVLIALLTTFAGCARKSSPEPARPPTPGPQATPFTIEYRLITYFPTCRGNRRVKVDLAGKVWFQLSDKDCPRGEDFSAPYPAQPKATLDEGARGRLRKLIVDGGFFDLKPPARGPVSDGFREEIEVELDGRRATVTVHDGARLDGWNELKSALLEHTR